MLPRVPSATLAAIVAAVTFSFVGCGRQNEGERCSLDNGDSDCDDGLVCTEAADLAGADGVDRCCPESGASISDERCEPSATTGDGDAAGEGGVGGESAGDSDPAGSGDSCVYHSDCQAPLYCVTGVCRVQCQNNRDCPFGEICSADQTCVAE